MRIGQVSHRYLPSIGGIENYVYRLSRDLSRMGHEVEIFTATPAAVSSPPGVVVRSVRTVPIFDTNPIPIGLHRQLQVSKLDIIHFHSPWYLTSILPLLHDLPSAIMTVHGLFPERRSIGRDYGLGLLYCPALVAIQRCSSVIALTSAEQRRVIKLFGISPERLHTIPNGVDSDCCSNAGRARDVRSGDQSPSVLFVGRASKDSRVRVAIDAFLGLRRLRPSPTFTLAGPGTDALSRGTFLNPSQGIGGRIRGLGAITRNRLCGLYSSHDVFLSLGTWEGLPTRVLEAMLHGCVPVVSDSGGISDVVTDHENGLVLRKTTPASVRGAVESLLNDPNLLTALSNAAIRTVSERFLWRNVFTEIVPLYESAGGS